MTDQPSADALRRRVERAERHAAFAESRGWAEVAQAYRRLAADLEALAKRAER